MTPEEPGWWWYRDQYYDGPLFIDWTGFICRTAERELTVEACCDEDQEMLGEYVRDLPGKWLMKIERPKDDT